MKEQRIQQPEGGDCHTCQGCLCYLARGKLAGEKFVSKGDTVNKDTKTVKKTAEFES